jgi:hypothetical protein
VVVVLATRPCADCPGHELPLTHWNLGFWEASFKALRMEPLESLTSISSSHSANRNRRLASVANERSDLERFDRLGFVYYKSQ